MEELKEYTIPFIGLKNGEHHFDFQIEQAFFDHFAEFDFELLVAVFVAGRVVGVVVIRGILTTVRRPHLPSDRNSDTPRCVKKRPSCAPETSRSQKSWTARPRRCTHNT